MASQYGQFMGNMMGPQAGDYRNQTEQAPRVFPYSAPPDVAPVGPSAPPASPGVPDAGVPSPESPTSPAPKQVNTALRDQLMRNGFGGKEGDVAKIDDLAHVAKSPKYQIANTALDLGLSGKTEDNPVLLAELQKRYPDVWKDWAANGGDLAYRGDPSKLNAEFDGVNSIDDILSSHEGGKGFWYGAGTPGSAGSQHGTLMHSLLNPMAHSDPILSANSKLSDYPNVMDYSPYSGQPEPPPADLAPKKTDMSGQLMQQLIQQLAHQGQQ